MKIELFHARTTKIMKFLEFLARNHDNHANLIIQSQNIENHDIHIIQQQNNENHKKLIIPMPNHEHHEIHKIHRQNQENYENLMIPYRIMKIMKFIEFHARILNIMKN